MRICCAVLPYRIFGCWASLVLLLAGLGSCVEPYAPAIINAPPSLLVVDGFLNANGPTTIRLSRTAALDVKATPSPEVKAQLVVESEAGGVLFGLNETAPGVYASAASSLPAGRQYRLRITIQRGTQYASAYVPVKRTPPIDALEWKPENNAVSVLVSTHDDTRNSQYYRWEFEETWEIRPTYRPILQYQELPRDTIIDIPVAFPDICWVSEEASRVSLSQTTSLSQDKVADFRLQTLPFDDPKLFSRYSIRVRQQALTRDEFDYWQLLRKNTESLGTLFDPQPSQLTGNVVCLDDPTQLALGYVGAHSVTEKRLFIAQPELPKGWGLRSGDEECVPADSILGTKAQIIGDYFGRPDYLPIDYILSKAGFIIGYTGKSRDCVDCRQRGTSIRPSFW